MLGSSKPKVNTTCYGRVDVLSLLCQYAQQVLVSRHQGFPGWDLQIDSKARNKASPPDAVRSQYLQCNDGEKTPIWLSLRAFMFHFLILDSWDC